MVPLRLCDLDDTILDSAGRAVGLLPGRALGSFES